MFNPSFIIVALLLCLYSCSKSHHGTSKKTTRITDEQVQDILDHQEFDCASIDGDACPQGMARLFIIERSDFDQSALCSGFMVGPTTLVTNHHCVANQEQCENTFIAIYKGDTYQTTKCKRVIKAEEDFPNENDPRRKLDYSVLETEEMYTGDSFSYSNDGVVNHQQLTTWVVDHTGLDSSTPNLYESRITEFKCRVDRDQGLSSLMLSHCPVIHGNSGSPVLDQNENVVGVVWGATAAFDSSIDLSVRRNQLEFAAVTESQYFKAISVSQ